MPLLHKRKKQNHWEESEFKKNVRQPSLPTKNLIHRNIVVSLERYSVSCISIVIYAKKVGDLEQNKHSISGKHVHQSFGYMKTGWWH